MSGSFVPYVLGLISGVALVAAYIWVANHEPQDDGDGNPAPVTVRGMSLTEILLAAILIVDIVGLALMVGRTR